MLFVRNRYRTQLTLYLQKETGKHVENGRLATHVFSGPSVN